MKLSDEAKHIIGLLWKDGKPMSTNFIIGNTYAIKDKKFKASEKLYEELVAYQKYIPHPYKIMRFGKIVNLIGTNIKQIT